MCEQRVADHNMRDGRRSSFFTQEGEKSGERETFSAAHLRLVGLEQPVYLLRINYFSRRASLAC